MSLGTLREQLLYPNPKVAADDAYLHEARLEGERAPEKDRMLTLPPTNGQLIWKLPEGRS